MKRIIGFLLFAFLYSISIFASNEQKIEAYRFSRLSQEDGLADNHIECIYKDSDGFIWFGTRNGLSRFDGYDFKNFYSNNESNSVSGNRILSISEDFDGNLWIGTYNNGLNKFDKKTETFTEYGASYGIGVWVNRVKVFSDSSIWACTAEGLARYNPEVDSFQVFKNSPNNPESLNANGVYDIILTSNNDLYVATESYFIQKFDPIAETFTTVVYNRKPELNTNFKKRIVEDLNGVLWISANVHGLSSYNPATGESDFYTQGEGSLSSNILTGTMVLDAEGKIWIGTDGGGVNIFNPETRTFSYLTEGKGEGSISSNSVYSIYIDKQNILWLGTYDNGVNYYDPERYKFVSSLYTQNDLAFFNGLSILSIFQDTKSRIWVGTDGSGMYMIDKDGNVKEFRYKQGNPNSISTDVITCFDEDKFGNILIGTYAGGFMSYDVDKDKFTYFNQNPYFPHFVTSSSVWDILHDSEGRIWLGLLGNGYDTFVPETKKFYNHGPSSNSPHKIDFTNIMVLLEDSERNIWFGTEGKGIFILDSKSGAMYQMAADSTYAVSTKGLIKCMFEDSWGQIWIGTEGDGAYIYNKDQKEFQHFDHNDGLAGNIVLSISEDIVGNVWLGTSSGLSVFDADGRSFRNYYQSDGLKSNSFNQNAMLKLADGRILCGTTGGIDVIRAEQVESNNYIPPIVFTSLRILNQELKPGDEINGRVVLEESINSTEEIVLNHRDKVFSLHFSALNYTLPLKCLYQYRLDGFDEDWVTRSSDNRSVSYTNLPAGQYLLRIKASNNDGFWSDYEKQLKIKILPPFYKTVWFKSFLLLLLLFLIYSSYRYRLNSIRSNFLKKQYEQDKRIMDLEKEKLDSELQKLTFHVLNRNRELINQKNRLLGLSMKAKESVRIGLQDIISKFDEELNDDKDWKYIEPQLDKVYNNFVSRLKEKHLNLSISEVKIAAYVRMDLSTKEIAEFMHKTPRAIENDRYRLRKKLDLDTNDSLKDYLNSL